MTVGLAFAVLAIAGVAEAKGDPRRRHHPHRRRRLLADQAAQARKRADHACTAAARSRPSPAPTRRSSKTSTSNSTATAPSKRPAWPSASERQLEARTVAAARKACPDAIVGKGYGHAIVAFPESKPINVDSPITLFNGPKKGGNPTVLAHAYTTYPVAGRADRPGRDRKNPQGRLRLPHQSEAPEDRRRGRDPDLRPPDDRQEMDLQGQEALLRQRPLRNRAPAGAGRSDLQRRHLPQRRLHQGLPGPPSSAGVAPELRRGREARACGCRRGAARCG